MFFVIVTKTDRKPAQEGCSQRFIKHREKLHANPQLLEEYRRKERERGTC
jgi:hypothetical protein